MEWTQLEATQSTTQLQATQLHPRMLQQMPSGRIRPAGWLLNQLKIQANGLTGHLDEFWPSIAESKWIGGQAEGWERGPYWLDGLIPLAVLLEDEPEGAPLWDKAQRWIDYIVEHQHEDGWLGARDDPHQGSGESVLDPWPLAVLFKAFAQWHEATTHRGAADERVIEAMHRGLRRIDLLLNEKPLENWARMRWFELALACLWLYERTGEEWLLNLAEKTRRQGYDWGAHFADFKHMQKPEGYSWSLESHGPNHAMALKEPAIRYRLDGDASQHRRELQHYLDRLDRFHGQVAGIFSNDECLAGLNPSQGAETCSVVEAMFSLEEAIAALGQPALCDRLERLAFNALPAPFTHDMWARQYDQQVNQVLVSRAPRGFVSNGEDANLFSLEGEFGCCTANMHQGWPKFTQNLWMSSSDGLWAVAFAPCRLTTEVEGVAVGIEETTEYPFGEDVNFTIHVSQPVSFALRLHIPAWAENAVAHSGEETWQPAPGSFWKLKRQWHDGDTVHLHLPMPVRLEERPRGAVAVLRGPLVFALQIGEEFRHLKGDLPHADWEVHPTTPWNYALEIDRDAPEKSVTFEYSGVGGCAFSSGNAPVRARVRGRQVPEWTLEMNAAGPLPPSPVASDEPEQEIALIPYGCTNLRVAEFPWSDGGNTRNAPRP